MALTDRLREAVCMACDPGIMTNKSLWQKEGEDFWNGAINILERSQESPEIKARSINCLRTARRLEVYLSYKNYLSPVYAVGEKVVGGNDDLLHEYLEKMKEEKKGSFFVFGKIGQGAFGSVYLALDQGNRRWICIKILKRVDICSRDTSLDLKRRTQFENAIQEVSFSQISEVYGDMAAKNIMMYALQYAYYPGLSMSSCWEEIVELPPHSKMLLLQEILQGIVYLHLCGWVHRDIAPSNILVDFLGDFSIKIIDFGLSKKLGVDDKGYSIAGYGHEEAPEVKFMMDIDSQEAIDVWCFGSLAYKFLTGQPADIDFYECLVGAGKRRKEDVLQFETIQDLGEIDFPEFLGPTMRSILAKAVAKHPANRPSASEILEETTRWLADQDKMKFKELRTKLFKHSRHIREALQGVLQMCGLKFERIKVSTHRGDAFLRVREGNLLSAHYGEIKGADVLHELLDESTLLYSIYPMKGETGLSLESSLEKDVNGLLEKLVLRQEALKEVREGISGVVRGALSIDDFQKVRCRQCLQEKGDREELQGGNLVLYGETRFSLVPWCEECLNRHGKKDGPPSPSEAGNIVFLLDQNADIGAKFYLERGNTEWHNMILYAQPTRIDPESWKNNIAERIKRGYEILKKYPSHYFLNLKNEPQFTKLGKENCVLLRFEYCAGISLRQWILFKKKSGGADVQEWVSLMLQDLAKALRILHHERVVHRNIEPKSILVGTRGEVKLGDFSLCKFDPDAPENEDLANVTVEIARGLGKNISNAYTSPESFNTMALATVQSDIWSWGIMAYELYTGRYPFSADFLKRTSRLKGNDPEEVMEKTRKEFGEVRIDCERLPSSVREIVEPALQVDPSSRPTADSIVAFFEKLNV